MAKEKKEKKGFFKEFKEFISRGNVLDLAVGIIIGGAFTAIVTALCDNVLKPVINWILALIIGTDSLDGVFTFLKEVRVDGVIDLEQSIYIDWGSLINAIINFILIALILFMIIKIINKVHQVSEAAKEARQRAEEEEEKKEAPAAEASAEASASEPAAPAEGDTVEEDAPKEE